jgi:S1-C subfamily serine protease
MPNKFKADGKVHKVTKKATDKGIGKKGDIIVEQNGKKGKERMNLTKLAGSKTVTQGVKATKDFHRKNGTK